ncbi:hypothetical protein FPHYL_4135 [Fusarium phyllophilum]|uniref:Uncharacterized protein n=1 Tax=Fusarium phyllophilum TaxID=47803 RepID=A0A8H5NHM0_9HYPO|nr:hypothetical protein FPHYL_4135 [Fusarium phyllophilum]
MPPKKLSNAQNKRSHDGPDNGQPASKSARTNEAPAAEQGESSQGPRGSRKRHIPRGPKGEAMMPQIMPRECAESKAIEAIPMPSRWIAAIDATPGREMTLGSRKWWDDHGPWLDAHKKALKLSAANWKMRDEAMKQDDTVPDDEGADDWDFICMPIPRIERGSDDEDEDDEDEEDDEEDEGEGEAGNDAEKDKDKKPYDKLASLHPEWPWFFTMRGVDRHTWWEQECLKRSPDDFDLYIYNDFGGYGALEVLENIIAQFNLVFKPKSTYRNFWPEVEGLAMILRGGLLEYVMIDDGARVQVTCEVVGDLILATIEALKKQDVFKPDSEIRNLGLVLFMFIRWGREQSDYGVEEENWSWIYKIIDLAEEAGIKLTAPHNFEKDLEDIKDHRDEWAQRMGKWNNVKWNYRLRDFKDDKGSTKLGGHEFDITRMSKAQRQQHSLSDGGDNFLM